MLVCRMLLAENQEKNQKRDFKLETSLYNLLCTWCSWADKMIELEERSEVMTVEGGGGGGKLVDGEMDRHA